MAKAARQSKSKAPRQPYDTSSRTRGTRPQPKPSTGESSQALSAPASAIPSPCFPIFVPASATGAVLYRDFCAQYVEARYPGIKPRSDWELLFMSGTRLNGTPNEVYAILDKEYLQDLEAFGDDYDEVVAETLNQYIEPTGIKPFPKETNKYIHIRPVPGTKYSIRLFPGSVSAAEYCLDFVDSATGEPVNSPFEFELWGVPDPDTPWLSMPIAGQMHSIERVHGIKQQDILPGHEKFILRDGLTCVLVRPGKPKIRFKVPVRKLPEQPGASQEEEIVLDLPGVIE
ncbi:hypothetical protein BN946_scf184970.g150 [Trametes cinnabarina]|uniref:Uncharacterized protein n=1 Tax=Pycnoporus cinnabarinus TaxID=5643 RepID=A0A060SIR9_PYCCI|nr:hypothetical protein BN946_scf184970.g150 [Trametes cinnabarina]